MLHTRYEYPSAFLISHRDHGIRDVLKSLCKSQIYRLKIPRFTFLLSCGIRCPGWTAARTISSDDFDCQRSFEKRRGSLRKFGIVTLIYCTICKGWTSFQDFVSAEFVARLRIKFLAPYDLPLIIIARPCMISRGGL